MLALKEGDKLFTKVRLKPATIKSVHDIKGKLAGGKNSKNYVVEFDDPDEPLTLTLNDDELCNVFYTKQEIRKLKIKKLGC